MPIPSHCAITENDKACRGYNVQNGPDLWQQSRDGQCSACLHAQNLALALHAHVTVVDDGGMGSPSLPRGARGLTVHSITAIS